MAECGTCMLCCKLLGVEEIEKPPGQWCPNCELKERNKGCRIYDSRPVRCREFECGWLANDGPLGLRPDRIHLVVTGESDKLDAYIVHVDPAYPHAPLEPKAKALLEYMMRHGKHKNIVFVTGNKRRFIGNDPGRVARLLDQMEIAGNPVV